MQRYACFCSQVAGRDLQGTKDTTWLWAFTKTFVIEGAERSEDRGGFL